MELQTAIEILEYHQEWRLGKREDMINEPKKLTEAIDIVLSEVKKFRLGAVMRSRFNKGDIVICWLKGGGYGDKFTVLEDTGGLTLLCHKTGSLCIVNNREDYDFA